MMIVQVDKNPKQGENNRKFPKHTPKSVEKSDSSSSSEPITGSSTESDGDKNTDIRKYTNSSDIDYRKLIPAQSVSVRKLKIRGTRKNSEKSKMLEKSKQSPLPSRTFSNPRALRNISSEQEESQNHQPRKTMPKLSASEEGEILSDNAQPRKISVDSAKSSISERRTISSTNRPISENLPKNYEKKVQCSSEIVEILDDDDEAENEDDDDRNSLDALEQDLIDPLAEIDNFEEHPSPGTPCEDDTVQRVSSEPNNFPTSDRRNSCPDEQGGRRDSSVLGDLVQVPEVYFDIFLDQVILDLTQDVFKSSIERECCLVETTANLFDQLLVENIEQVAVESTEKEVIERATMSKTYCGMVEDLVKELLEEEKKSFEEDKKHEDLLYLLENIEAHDDCCLEGTQGSSEQCSRFCEALESMDERLENTWVKDLADFDDITVKGKSQICLNELFSRDDFADLSHERMIEIEFDQEDYEVVYKWPNLARKQRFQQRKSAKSPAKIQLDAMIAAKKESKSGKNSNSGSRKRSQTVSKSISPKFDGDLPIYDKETEDCFASQEKTKEVISLLSSDESEKATKSSSKSENFQVEEKLYEPIISSIVSDLVKETLENEKRKENELVERVTEKSVLRIFQQFYGNEHAILHIARESIDIRMRELVKDILQNEKERLVFSKKLEEDFFTHLVQKLVSELFMEILPKEKSKASVAMDSYKDLVAEEVRNLLNAQKEKKILKEEEDPSLRLSEEDSVLIERWWHEAQPKKFSISTLLGKSPSSSAQPAAAKIQPGMTGAVIPQEQMADVFDPLSALGLDYSNNKRRQSIMEELNGLKYAVCDSKSPKVTTPGKDKLANSKGTPKDYRSNFQKGACSSNSNSPKSELLGVSSDATVSSTASSSSSTVKPSSSSKAVSRRSSRKLQRPTENVFDGIRRTLGERRPTLTSIPSICGSRKDLTIEDPLECVDNYRLDAIIGEGTFGQVFRGECKSTKSLVALKKVRMDREKEGFPITAIREVKLLSKLNHRNVVDLKTVVQAKDLSSFFLVFEFVDNDLTGIIEHAPLKSDQIKKLFYQILLGLEYCHANDVFHRDLKCSNILIAKDGSVKLGDFGLARICLPTDSRPFTNKVITLWYRPPELLVGDDRYTGKIDMWSAGCILGEMYQRKPVFQASTDVAQLEVISKLCGIPDPAAWPEIIHYKHFKTLVTPLITRFHPKPRRKIAEQFCALPPDALEVLDGLLRLNPKTRLSATEALKKPWFRNLSEDTRADLGSPENLHEMSARRKRKAKRQAKRADSFSDKMTKIKRLTTAFPQLTLMILAEKAGIELTHEVRENLGSQRLSRIFGSTLPQQTIEPIADIVIQLASKNISIRKTARL
ncbi:Oidioi.mRNA.OKI2018_I69.PAR.g12043.t1.cds [Oikopleura dioica]|uniref:Oidioi.mRNA.OKI2018_I69.PAR.g12043.t1.cds n=1 Tax=Oikopleura dioica TaxID=34765 RepID=A0ABN7S5Y0_OIKDI|nr:Oidioi.mRNA.OKI2018_I69.PAR.g12043.t1.cds [Oikopleura dioica]